MIVNAQTKTAFKCFPLFFLFLLAAPQGFGADSSFKPAGLAFSVTPAIAAPGSHLRCQFQFANQGIEPSSAPERIFVHFESNRDCAAIQWQADHEPLIPTTYWMPGDVIKDGPFYVSIPENTPEGEYFVHIGLWNPVSGARSLDVYLPDAIRIENGASLLENAAIEPLAYDETVRRMQTLQRRFDQGTIAELENDKIHFQLQCETGVFSIHNKSNNMTWQSLPGIPFGTVYAQKNGKRQRAVLSSLSILQKDAKQCALQKDIDGQPLLDLTIRLEKNDSALTFSWTPAPEWSLEEIDFDSLLWTTESLGGGAVIPRLMGQFFLAGATEEFNQTYRTYDGWGGLNMPMSGILRRRDAAMISWNNNYASIRCQSTLVTDSAIPGGRLSSLSLHCPTQANSFRLQALDNESYVDLAKAYRRQAAANKTLAIWREKLNGNREASRLFGAPIFKPFVCVRQLRKDDKGEIKETVYNSYSADDCLALAQHIHDDLKLEKTLFVLAGWIHRGYDNQHPDILPAAPEIGGDQGVERISARVRSYGYLFGLHDNYQDMYEDAPSWNPSMLIMNRDGSRRKGGVWAGGQAWLIASNYGCQLAARNLPEAKRLYEPNAYFIDTTFAAPLYESYDPLFPMTYDDDLKYKQSLFKQAGRFFSVMGSETGMEFGVPVTHYFEGILSGRELIKNFPHPGAIPIPFFPLVFHDCIAMYTHQGDRCGIGDARKILRHLITGSMPLYNIGPHQYWNTEFPEVDFTQPEYCFARSGDGWGKGKHPMDRFIKNTYEFLSPFSEATAILPMTGHEYVKDDLSVERSWFGENWSVIVNYGPNDYLAGKTLLPPMGFIAAGHDFLAQHYYPDANTKRSMLLVKKGNKTYIGFR
ncbi:MAG: DUF5696 domain-containing protein [Candidatus Omnitrophota bacterium]